MKRVLFVGCGEGTELQFIEGNPDVMAVGLEPSRELCRRADERFQKSKNIKIVQSSLQEFCGPLSQNLFDTVYFLFPVPSVLVREGRSMSGKLKELLNPDGMITLYTEVILSPKYPEFMNCVFLKMFFHTLREDRWRLEVGETKTEELPAFVKGSGFGAKLLETECTKVTEAVIRLPAPNLEERWWNMNKCRKLGGAGNESKKGTISHDTLRQLEDGERRQENRMYGKHSRFCIERHDRTGDIREPL